MWFNLFFKAICLFFSQMCKTVHEYNMALHLDSIAPIFEDTLCSQATIIGSFFFVLTGILCEAPMYLVSIVYNFITLSTWRTFTYFLTSCLGHENQDICKYNWWQFFKNWPFFSKIKCFKIWNYQKWFLTKIGLFLMSYHLLYLQSTLVFFEYVDF